VVVILSDEGLFLDSRLRQRVVVRRSGVGGLGGQLGEVLHVGVGDGRTGRRRPGRVEPGRVARRRRLHAQLVNVVPDQTRRTAHQMQHLQFNQPTHLNMISSLFIAYRHIVVTAS